MGEEWGGGGGGWASRRWTLPAIRLQTVVLCSLQMTGMYTNHKTDQDGHWQQFGTQPFLINAPQLAIRPCNAPSWFYRVGKKPSVKADLAIYSHTLEFSGRCMSICLILCELGRFLQIQSHISNFKQHDLIL